MTRRGAGGDLGAHGHARGEGDVALVDADLCGVELDSCLEDKAALFIGHSVVRDEGDSAASVP